MWRRRPRSRIDDAACLIESFRDPSQCRRQSRASPSEGDIFFQPVLIPLKQFVQVIEINWRTGNVHLTDLRPRAVWWLRYGEA